MPNSEKTIIHIIVSNISSRKMIENLVRFNTLNLYFACFLCFAKVFIK